MNYEVFTEVSPVEVKTHYVPCPLVREELQHGESFDGCRYGD